MAFKLVEAAQARWRAVNAPHFVALVSDGVRFANGHLVERPDELYGIRVITVGILGAARAATSGSGCGL